ncbi:hypothetical protein DFJ77DRAFT_506059 [Powellomyces hirtus]|nr:hypothetical protein DFJ77DRAFT_506059 [Powellomyces hirtus]
MLAGSGPSGFYNAPVTKALVFSLGLNTLLASFLDVRHKWHLQLWPQLLQHHQIYRLVTTNLFFSTTSELLFGTCLLYHFRILERQWSSSKYASFVFLTSAMSTALNVASLLLTRGLGFKSLRGVPAGPYGLVFAALYAYGRSVPGTYKFKFAGKEWTDHVLVYALSFQFLLAQLPTSVVGSVCGLVAGVLYDLNFLEMKIFRLPRFLQNLAHKAFTPLFASSPPTGRLAGTTIEDQRRELRDRYTASMRGNAAAAAAVAGTGGIPVVPVDPPSPDAIAQLENMGFSRPRVLQALRSTNNHVPAAAAFLLDNRQ